MSALTPIYHYTCDHAHLQIGAKGTLFPGYLLANVDTLWPARFWPAHLVWCTDLSVPIGEALGLTRVTLPCDRTAHRYRVDDGFDDITPWLTFRKMLFRTGRGEDAEALESAPGARPAHWYVSTQPLPVTYDPVGVRS